MFLRGGNARHEHWEVDSHSVNAAQGIVLSLFATTDVSSRLLRTIHKMM